MTTHTFHQKNTQTSLFVASCWRAITIYLNHTNLFLQRASSPAGSTGSCISLKKLPCIHTIDLYLFKEGTQGLSSQLIQNPASVGPLSFMSGSSTQLPSLEDLIVRSRATSLPINGFSKRILITYIFQPNLLRVFLV